MAWSTSPDRYRGVPRHLADKIRRRDDYTCQICGAPGNDVDHIINVKNGGDDHPDNLQVLCTRHHQAKTQQEATQARARRGAKHPKEPHPGLLAQRPRRPLGG